MSSPTSPATRPTRSDRAIQCSFFLLLPLLEAFLPLDQRIASFGAFLPFIHTKRDIVLFNALPFNILKGLVIGGFAMLT